jgi:PAS domain S-box-containing protein
MKKNFETIEEHPIRIGYYLLGTVVFWSILIGLSLGWNLRTQESGFLEAVRIEARTAFEKDVIYRSWNAARGGVYATITEVTQPNPYLDIPERDITTPLGKKLTKINPAYMTRQVHELTLKARGIRGHITSLNPIRPANAPDPWETRALIDFQTGLKEVSSVEEIEGNVYMRLMRPLSTEKGCLKCHAAQGYKLGDIRGGISVSIPMAPHTAIAQSHIFALCVGHGLLWLTGLFGIGFAFRRLNQQILKRKGMEGVLRESEGRFRTIMEQSPAAIEIYEPKGRLLAVNDAWAKFWGLKKEAIADFNIFNDPECERTGLTSAFREVQQGRTRVLPEIYYDAEESGLIGGQKRWIRAIMYPIMDEKRTVNNIVLTYDDITERKQAEGALRESEEKYRTILEDIEDGYFEVDIAGNLTFFNGSVCEIFGYSKDELIGMNYRQYTDEENAKKLYQTFNRVYTTGKSDKGFDWEIIGKDGNKRLVEASISPKMDSEGRPIGFQGIVRDVSVRKQIEKDKAKLAARLHRAEKMEAMGLMAGGVAHDLNNILSGIVSYPELLLMDLPEDSPLRNPIKTIQESGMRAADVVEDLLTIARGVATGKEVLNLNTVVKEYLGFAEQKELEKNYPLSTFKTELDAELLNISCSVSHVKKALMNLIVNASEAIEESGTVIISTTNQYLDEPLKGYEDVRIGEYVLLSVSDDGSGISPKDLDRLFEPFYTKKVMGRSGTGLGLAVVWNIMQDHDGYINVKGSEKGTVFELYFPTTREQVTDGKEQVPLDDYLGHGEKVLVVDDEERQREIASGILTRLDYIAETVSSGEEAIEYVKENPVDLIVLDMVMPKGINGRKTYEEIIKIRPGQKAILASGYAKTKEVGLAQELGAGKYIKKPYTLEKVGVAVKEELEK